MKPEFMNELVVKVDGPYKWLLFRPLKYWSLLPYGKPNYIEVPKMFKTDLASIPRAVRSLIPQNGRHRQAAVVHDYLYRTAASGEYTRKQADDIFLEAMSVDGVPKYRAMVMYSFVRLWGWRYWNRRIRREDS